MAPRGSFAPPRPRDPDTSLSSSMATLAMLAGWSTVPHPRDREVVRLALNTARDRHDPDQGGSRELSKLVVHIEGRWLEEVLAP